MPNGKRSHPSRPVLVHLPLALIDRLDHIARANGVTRSELIRSRLCNSVNEQAVRDDLAQPSQANPSPLELFKRQWRRITY
jgi:hypothetical protein